MSNQLATTPEAEVDTFFLEGTDRSFQDSPLSEVVAKGNEHQLAWTPGRGWLKYTGKRWEEVSEATATETVRVSLKEIYLAAVVKAESAHTVKLLAPLLTKSKIMNVTTLVRGILERDSSDFDQYPYLLNVQNGVVDLRTGDLLQHAYDFYFTKVTAVDWKPGASVTNPDWHTALEAAPEDIQAWLQVRFGQAVTGYMTDDDVLPILQGSGSNGKSTIVSAIVASLGDYAAVVPEKVLTGNSNDHSTEKTTLQGARFALIEETPEGRHLPTKALKDLLGTPVMTARRMRMDNETWNATHSLFLTTNYKPVVSETDHGTWRRLALVEFPFTFKAPGERLLTPNERHGDPGLRDRIRDNAGSQLEAVLDWVVSGAQKWFENGSRQLDIPATVKEDTAAWRAETDLILAYVNERLEFTEGAAVSTAELFSDFSMWLADSHRPKWSDGTFTARFQDHQLCTSNYVTKARPKTPPPLSHRHPFNTPAAARPWVWLNVKFQTI